MNQKTEDFINVFVALNFIIGGIFLSTYVLSVYLPLFFSSVTFWATWNYWHWLGALILFRIIKNGFDIKPHIKDSSNMLSDSKSKFIAVLLVWGALYLLSLGIS